jgi:isopentenyl phosphate kinase
MIFCIDVDGIYASPTMEGSIIEEFDREMLKVFIGHNLNVDVTGGIVRKLQIATEISNLGVDVYLVNGLKPEIVFKALNGVRGIGTCIKGMK